MKFVVAMMKHETNSFSPLPTPLSSFGRTGGHVGPMYGNQIVEMYEGTNNPIAGRDLDTEAISNLAQMGITRAEYEQGLFL